MAKKELAAMPFLCVCSGMMVHAGGVLTCGYSTLELLFFLYKMIDCKGLKQIMVSFLFFSFKR